MISKTQNLHQIEIIATVAWVAGYCKVVFLGGKNFTNQFPFMKILPSKCLLKLLITNFSWLFVKISPSKSWNRPIHENFPYWKSHYMVAMQLHMYMALRESIQLHTYKGKMYMYSSYLPVFSTTKICMPQLQCIKKIISVQSKVCNYKANYVSDSRILMIVPYTVYGKISTGENISWEKLCVLSGK